MTSIFSIVKQKLKEEAKKKIIELALKEHEEQKVKKERKPTATGDLQDPIDLESEESDERSTSPAPDYINVAKVVEIGESIKKNFGKHYSFCKKPRSAYIYFVKAARLECKDKGSTRDNFVEISRAISAKWNELKVNQRKVFDDCAVLDKRFNGFKTEAMKKKVQTGSHTSLFLKVRQEAREHHAATADPSRALNNLLAARARASTSRSRTTRTTTIRTKRKVKRRKTKKRKTTRRVKAERSVKTERKPVIKSERKLTIKSERKPLVKKERKVKRE